MPPRWRWLIYLLVLGLVLWVSLKGATEAQSGPPKKGQPEQPPAQDQPEDIAERKARLAEAWTTAARASKAAYNNEREQGLTEQQAARAAGMAAGRAAAGTGVTPAEAAEIAAAEAKWWGARTKDAIDAAVYAAREAGGNYKDVAEAARAAARSDLTRLNQEIEARNQEIEEMIREAKEADRLGLDILATELWEAIEAKTRHASESFEKAMQRQEIITCIIAATGIAARAAGATPDEEGAAIGAVLQGTLPTGFGLAKIIYRGYLKEKGKGLSPIDQGILVGNSLLSSGARSGMGAAFDAEWVVEEAGGKYADKLAVGKYVEALGSSGPEPEQPSPPATPPEPPPEREPQSRADTSRDDMERLSGALGYDPRGDFGMGGEFTDTARASEHAGKFAGIAQAGRTQGEKAAGGGRRGLGGTDPRMTQPRQEPTEPSGARGGSEGGVDPYGQPIGPPARAQAGPEGESVETPWTAMVPQGESPSTEPPSRRAQGRDDAGIQQGRGKERSGTDVPRPSGGSAEDLSATAGVTQPPKRTGTSLGAFAGAQGRWTTVDGGCGVKEFVLGKSGNQLVLQGLGQNVPLSVSGNTTTGQGATLFGKPGHKVVLTLNGKELRLDCSHPSGGACSSKFHPAR